MDPVIHLRRTKHSVFNMERRLKEYDLQSIISSKYEVGFKRVFLEQHFNDSLGYSMEPGYLKSKFSFSRSFETDNRNHKTRFELKPNDWKRRAVFQIRFFPSNFNVAGSCYIGWYLVYITARLILVSIRVEPSF